MHSALRKRIDADLGKLGYVAGAMFVLALVVKPLQNYVLPLLVLAVVITAIWSYLSAASVG